MARRPLPRRAPVAFGAVFSRSQFTSARVGSGPLKPLLAGLLLLAGPALASAQRPRPPGRAPVDTASETAVLTASAFGVEARLEIVPLERRAATRDALAGALEAIRHAEALLSPEPDSLLEAPTGQQGVAELNRQAGASTVAIDPDLFDLLQRALQFCEFSKGAFGPLGGHLVQLWGLRRPVSGRPTLAALSQASAAASCDRLILDADSRTAALAAGTLVDLLAFERAFAVDQAVAALRELGATDGWVQIGHVARAFGGGPDGDGWPIAVDATNPVTTATERILLRDRSLALAAAWLDPIEIAGDREPPHLDQRTGQPASGKVAVLAVTETAVDAAGLAAALFVMPQRTGRYQLGPLRPQPAIKWFLGTGEGNPLVAESRWAELPKWRPPRGPLRR